LILHSGPSIHDQTTTAEATDAQSSLTFPELYYT
jgi:hypothetical protein